MRILLNLAVNKMSIFYAFMRQKPKFVIKAANYKVIH